MRLSEEIRLPTPRGQLAGLRFAEPVGPPVLCLHGFLDNAASFIPIAHFLADLDIVAMDFPGHGHSDHHHPAANYHFMDYLADVDAALDALGWTSCHLVGHSMGAAVAALYAAAAPERVRSLVALDGLGPISEPPESGTSRLRKSVHSLRAGPRRKKAYSSIDDMIRARQANSDLDDESARLICERSITRRESHYEWRNDPALYWVSPVLLTEEQVLHYLRHIETGVLSLTAAQLAPVGSEEKVKSRAAAVRHGRHLTVEGDHHFHMHQPGQIAATIREFILEQERHFATAP